MSSELKTLSTKEVPIFNGSWREFGTFKHAFESFAIVNGVGDVILYGGMACLCVVFASI